MRALWHTQMARSDPQNISNGSLGMCPDLFHPCSTLFHQFGATRPAYGPKRLFLAVLDPVWPYIWPKWLEQEWCPSEQVNPYQNEAENIIVCHGKPTSKNPPSLTHCVASLHLNHLLRNCQLRLQVHYKKKKVFLTHTVCFSPCVSSAPCRRAAAIA